MQQDVIQLRRKQPYAYNEAERPKAPPPTHLRASRKPQPSNVDRHTQEDDELLDSLTGQSQQRQPGHTEKLRSGGPGRQQPRRQWSPWLFFGLGMLGMLVIWSIVLHMGVWYVGTFQDPATFTQTAHKDTITVTDAQGYRSQAQAFIDQQNHLDVLVIPEGDVSHAHIIPGPALTAIDDPQHQATITATAHGVMVTITAQGPLLAAWYDLIAYRQSQQWTTDASQPSSKGGKS